MADFTKQEREKLAASGAAMQDGSYPIRNRADLQDAIEAYGRATDKAAVMRHIIRRAKAISAMDLIPQNWNTSKIMNDAIRAKVSRT